jgi:hypothetical protein
MNYRLNFLPAVEQDVQDAYDWYEFQLPGLGEDFFVVGRCCDQFACPQALAE